MNKENFAYILGWYEENLTGKHAKCIHRWPQHKVQQLGALQHHSSLSHLYLILLLQLSGAAVGRLREGMLMGYDNKRMKGLWPTKDMCEGYRYALTPKLVPPSCLCTSSCTADTYRDSYARQ